MSSNEKSNRRMDGEAISKLVLEIATTDTTEITAREFARLMADKHQLDLTASMARDWARKQNKEFKRDTHRAHWATRGKGAGRAEVALRAIEDLYLKLGEEVPRYLHQANHGEESVQALLEMRAEDMGEPGPEEC